MFDLRVEVWVKMLVVDKLIVWVLFDVISVVFIFWFKTVMVVICGNFVNIFFFEIFVCVRIIVEVCDCVIVVFFIMLVELFEVSVVFKFVFIGSLVVLVLLINFNIFGEIGNDKEFEGRGFLFRVCLLRLGFFWLV